MTITVEQREARRTGIGGSDASIILGLNPFRDALTLYHEKRGELPPEEDDDENKSLKWGAYLEEPICEAYAETTGFKVIRQNQTLRSKKHPFMMAHIDRRVVGNDRKMGLEAKSDAFGYGWGPSGSNEIPAYVMCQVQHYLLVTEWDEFDLACLISGRDFRVYKIMPIPEIMERLVEAEEEFWDRVQAGVPPTPDFQHRAMGDLIKRFYPGTNGSVVRLPQVAQSYADVWRDASEQRSLYDKVVDGCKNRIAMLMGEASAAILPDGSVYTRKTVERAGYQVADSKYMDMRRTDKVPKLVTDAIGCGKVIVLPEVTV